MTNALENVLCSAAGVFSVMKSHLSWDQTKKRRRLLTSRVTNTAQYEAKVLGKCEKKQI